MESEERRAAASDRPVVNKRDSGSLKNTSGPDSNLPTEDEVNHTVWSTSVAERLRPTT
ncbi:unnamed protein product, partial [Ectocarpus fasciculatus]